MRQSLYASVATIALGLATPAIAGNIVLTGHDNDFHQSADAIAATTAELSFVRGSSLLPVLVIDDGSQAVSLVSGILGGGSVVAKTVTAVMATDFDHSIYSAFVVASVSTCGGCDNPVGSGTTLAGFSSAIATFFNAGGGILGFAGATDPNAYAYVPEAASNPGGSPPSSGYVQTADGLALGIPAVNGDPTHNFFNEPGSGGLSAIYKVTERLGSPTTGSPETVAASGKIVCTGTKCTIVGTPEPMTLSLLGAGMFGLAVARRRRRH